MTTLVFDTHDFVRWSHGAGVVTRQGLRETGLALKHDFREVELKLELKISETKAELVRWVIGVGLLQTTLITALLLKMSSGL